MKKAVIIDDELNGREILNALIESYTPELKVVGMADAVQTGLELIQKTQPDIVFLDIEMPGGTGFDLLEAVPERNFSVIFVTAFDEYAIQAIRSSALDYLLKPVNIDELKLAVMRAVQEPVEQGTNEKLDNLLSAIRAEVDPGTRKLALPTQSGFEMIDLDQILYCRSEGNYTRFFVRGRPRPLMVSKSIKQYEESLSGRGFMRIHKSHMINLAEVNRYINGKGGEVVMSDGASLEVSRTRKKELIDQLRLI